MKLLISITSWEQNPYFPKVIQNYLTEYADLELQFVLSVNYPFDPPLNSVVVTSQYTGWDFTYSNKTWINEHYQDFDYIIESDDDCLIPRKSFDHYLATSEWLKANTDHPLKYISGFLSVEYDQQGTEYYITLKKHHKNTSAILSIKDKTFMTPHNLHSTCFIADKERYALALERGMKTEPHTQSFYTSAELSRSSIYFHFQKLVELGATGSTVHHTPNKYHNFSYPARLFTMTKADLNTIYKNGQ